MADAPFCFGICGSITCEKSEVDFEYGFKFEWAKTNSFGGASIVGEQLPLEGNILALEKLAYYDDLFYVGKLRSLLSMNVMSVNTLDNPDDYFSGKVITEDISGYSLAFPKASQVGYFVNSLQKLDPERYELLKNTVLDLLPNIEDFTPVQVDLSGSLMEAVPYQVPNVFYDIRIKERNNNQPTSIASVSTGCKKILLLVVMLVKQASAEEVSLGEYLFELMLDMEDNSQLTREYF